MTYVTSNSPTENVPDLFDNAAVTHPTGDDPYTLDLFDTSGYDDHAMQRALLYPQTEVFLVCFSVVSPQSFESVKAKWFREIRYHCPRVPCLLVGTQIDLREEPLALRRLTTKKERPVTTTQGERLARKLGAFKYVECSAMTRQGLKIVFDEAIAAAMDPASGKTCPVCVVA
ncbi:ras-domain-containing protein [Clavulina sp. PMI_390]|nr:ras-domain-containing protein [Clavulina sp. PMI_390]